jgi:hypothetical protein
MSTTGSHIELSDFTAQYPSIDDPEIQTKISAKWEFAKLASYPRDFRRNPSGFYNHQDLVERLLRVYSRMILMHETGSGKSYIIGEIGEAVKNRNDIYNGRNIRGVIVVVKGKTQLIDIKMTLVCKSTGGKYLPEDVDGSGTEHGQKSAITRSLNKWYDIRTYGTFAKEINDLTDNEIGDRYSDYLIIMDEFHNVRLIDEKIMSKKKKLKPSENTTLQMWRLSHYAKRSTIVGLSASIVINKAEEAIGVLNIILPLDRQIPDTTNMNSITIEELEKYTRGYISYVRSPDTQVYKNYIGNHLDHKDVASDGVEYESQLILHRLIMSDLQSASYRVAYLSETREGTGRQAILQSPNPVYLFSRQASKAIYPDGSWGNTGFNNYIKPDGKGWYKAEKGLLEYYNSGRIRELSVGTDEVINICKNAKGLVVIFDEHVSGSGLNFTAVAMDNLGFEKFDSSKSMFVSKGRKGPAPYCSSGSTSLRSVRQNVQPISSTRKIRYTMITTDTKNAQLTNIFEAVNSPENINSDYIRVIMISGKGKEGINLDNMFTFIQYGGVWTPTAEHQAESRGFRAVSHKHPLEVLINEVSIKGMNTPQLEVARRKGADADTLAILSKGGISMDIASKWVYVIVDIHKFAVYPNKKYVNKLLPPEGTLERIREMGINAVEHKILSAFVETDISSLRQPQGDYAIKLVPFIYEYKYFSGTPIYSIDEIMYIYTESKNVDFKKLRAKMMATAIDCQIHHERNIWPDDRDYSPESNYGPKDWSCFSPTPTEYDFSTSDVYYIEEALDIIRPNIQEYFKKNGSGSISMIQKSIDPNGENPYAVRTKYIETALSKIILNRETIKDRFGYSVYLQENDGIYFTSREFPVSDVSNHDQTSSFYGSTFIVNNHSQIDKYIVDKELTSFDKTLGFIKSISTEIDNYSNTVKDMMVVLPIESQVLLLEYAVEKFLKGDTSKVINGLTESFSKVLFYVNEPKSRIRAISDENERKKGGKRGKKGKRGKNDNEDKSGKTREDFSHGFQWDVEQENELVYIHSLYTHRPSVTDYAAVSGILGVSDNIRILKMSENSGWRDPNESEEEAYKYYVQMTIYNRHLQMDIKFPDIYGIDIKYVDSKTGTLAKDAFHIRDIITESTKAKMSGSVNLRNYHRGRTCMFYNATILTEYLWIIGANTPTGLDDMITSMEDMVEFIQEKYTNNLTKDGTYVTDWDRRRLSFYYQWLGTSLIKSDMCRIIKNTMKMQGRILELR